MADWAPVLIGVVLFVLLSPGLLFSFPGNSKQLEFGSMKTNGKAIAIHTLLFFAIYAVFDCGSPHPYLYWLNLTLMLLPHRKRDVGRLGASSGGSGAVCVVFTRVAVSAAWKQKSSGIC
ncbi:hypothetical protein GOBAR_DD09801 [Gossypium barbadense]|nr:hypothetical protein GOBAR_DD09801 [Gossypium barbadense]